jgi:hypothetical protein
VMITKPRLFSNNTQVSNSLNNNTGVQPHLDNRQGEYSMMDISIKIQIAQRTLSDLGLGTPPVASPQSFETIITKRLRLTEMCSSRLTDLN